MYPDSPALPRLLSAEQRFDIVFRENFVRGK